MMRAAATIAGLLLLAGCGDPVAEEDAAPGAAYADWYPSDIRPPDNLAYPGPFTPLPADLAGIPLSHHGYVNHAFSLVLKAVHQRLLAHEALRQGRAAFADLHGPAVALIVGKLMEQTVPGTLRGFQDDLVQGIELQAASYRTALARGAAGATPEEALKASPEAEASAARIRSALSRLEARYPRWSPAVRDSIRQHLLALIP